MDSWHLPSPHLHAVAVANEDIDGYGHVNNAVYVRWLDEAAWSHSTALGLSPEACIGIRKGMAVLRTQIHYVAPALAGDRVVIGTWIIGSDGRLRVSRRFQVRRAGEGRTLVLALVHYVCIDLDTGRARRMPTEFVARYRALDVVLAAVAGETAAFEPGVEPACSGPGVA